MARREYTHPERLASEHPCCPTCGQTVAGLSVSQTIVAAGLSRLETRLMERLASAHGQWVSLQRLGDYAYADDPDGGPDDAMGTVSVVLWRMRRKLDGLALRLDRRTKSGSRIVANIEAERSGGFRIVPSGTPNVPSRSRAENARRAKWRVRGDKFMLIADDVSAKHGIPIERVLRPNDGARDSEASRASAARREACYEIARQLPMTLADISRRLGFGRITTIRNLILDHCHKTGAPSIRGMRIYDRDRQRVWELTGDGQA